MKQKTKFGWQKILLFVAAIFLIQDLSAQVLASVREHKKENPKQQATQTALEEVLRSLESKFKVKFNYDSEIIEGKRVSDKISGSKNLEETLNLLLMPLNLNYRRLENKDYIIFKPETDKIQRLEKFDGQSGKVQSSTSSLNPLHDLMSKNLSFSNSAVDILVKGKVTGDKGEGLPGVSVVIKGTTVGTTTDAEGVYSINAPEGNPVLVFSFIGYVTEEVQIGNRSIVDVELVPDIQALSELVVVGYGTEKRATVTGSVATVKGADIVQSPATNVSNTLAGRLPGLMAVTRSGEPGYDGATIRIRGSNTLGNNDPLIVVDGIPNRSLERLDPNSIESITVLKDASAAIYGAQAANGVILVTTKRGKAGKPEISINLNQGYGAPTRLPEMANAAEYATLLNEIDVYRNRAPRYSEEDIQKFSDGSDPWRYPNTDWFKEVLKPWSGQNYGNVSIAGGNESIKYFVLFGAKSQDGFYKNSATKYSQYDFRSNLDGKISQNVNISFDLAGRQENRNFPTRSSGSIFRMVMRGKPHMPAYWPDGTPGPDIELGDNPAVVSTDATGYDRDQWYVLQSNLKLNVNIPAIKGLSLTGNVGMDKGFRFHKRFETPWYLYSWDFNSYDPAGKPVLTKGKKGFDDARLFQETEFNQNILLNALINYETRIAEQHSFKFLIGTEKRFGEGNKFDAYRRYFVSTTIDQLFAGGDAEKNNGGSAYQNARLNYFGRINYNFSEKYLLEFVWRYDGSYIFPEKKRFGFFPGISAGWRVSEEPFWKDNVAFVNNLKLRGSWGQTGNDRIDEWQYIPSYGLGAIRIFGVDQENKTLLESRIPNPNVTWEVANQSNIGFDAKLFDNKLTIEAEYFYNKRSQILWWRNASIPTSTGLSLPRENIGKVANSGFDFLVAYNNNLGELKYEVSVNGGYSKNKILFWDEAPGAPEYQQSTGFPMNTDLYYKAIGVFNDKSEVDVYPHWNGARPGDVIFEDVNKDAVIDANDKVRLDKNTMPRLTGGLNINLGFKGFDLAILFQGASGAQRYIYTETGDIGNFLRDFYDNRWTEANPTASYPRTFNRDEEYWRNQRNTFWLRKTDYVRLKNIQLGYTLPSVLTNRVGMQNVRIYVSGFNLLTYSPDLKDFDPETEQEGGHSYPLQKVINAGLSLTF